MSEDVITDGKTANEEKSSGSGKLESMSKEDLIKLVKNQVLFRKKLETKLNELTTAAASFTRTEEQLRNQIDHEQKNYATLTSELESSRLTQSNLQEELNLIRKSSEDFRLQNETAHATCQNLEDELTNLRNELSVLRSSLADESQRASSQSELLSNLICTTNDLFQLPISLPDLIDNEFVRIYINELEQKRDAFKQTCARLEQENSRLQERIEDLEFLSEEVKLENDELRPKVAKYQQEKQAHEQEIDNYRRQIEDFEEQFLEVQRESHMARYETVQEQPVRTPLAVEQTVDQIILQSMDHILDQIDHHQPQISKASSTSSLLLSSDIPTLLHSVGITNGTDEDFTVPLNFESVLRLCTLLIERCRVLQYILLKKNDISMTSLADDDYNNQCISFVQNHEVEQCRIIVHKQDHAALDTLFERIYTGMNQTISSNDWQIVVEKPLDQSSSPSLRLEFDHFKFVSDEVEQELATLRTLSEQQRNEISLLEQRLLSTGSLAQLKEQQGYLEKQLAEQCAKSSQLEALLKQENLDSSRLNQLKEIEQSYHELQEKVHIAEQLEEQLKQLQEQFREKELHSKRQHELFDKLKSDYERQHFYLLERDERIRVLQLEIEEHERFKETLIDKYQQEFEQQKLLFIQVTQNQEQRASAMVANENQTRQLENDLKQMRAALLSKEKQVDDLQLFNEQLQTEDKKLQQEIQFLTDKIVSLEKEKLELTQNIEHLKQQVQSSKLNFENSMENSKSTMEQGTIQLRQTSEHPAQDSEGRNSDLSKNDDALQSELVQVRQENETLHQTINELNLKYEKQISDPGENIQELKEKYQKMKVLLTRLKKELQDKPHAPKQSLIDLELADYDKTIKTLKEDLINKDKEVQELRDELSASTDKYACLKLEIQSLEQQKTQTDHRGNKFKALLDVAKKELQQAKDLELQRYHTDDHTRELMDKLHHELDNNKVLISALSNEKQQLTEKLNSQSDTSQRAVTLLEQNLRIAKHELDIAKKDYDTLQDDFNSYKVRAQSVLKQQQANQRERTPSLADKQLELEDTIEKLKVTLREAHDKIELLTAENEAMRQDQTRLVETHAKLINESKKREQDLRKQYQTELVKLERDYSQRLGESQDTVKTITLHTDTLSTAYKEQIASLEADHERSRRALQDQLEACQGDIQELRTRLELLQQTERDQRTLTSDPDLAQIGINYHSNRGHTLAWSDPARQQVENSQSIDNGYQSQDTTVHTSDHDLSGSISTAQTDAGSISSLPSDQSNHLITTNPTLDEFNQIKSRLLDTVELLNESELTNAHLTEQITFLKDEIRRLERNMERAESISNLEYLKNIILKFFILKSTPERIQLIPVLVTMLKLSPDEQAQLVRVANSAPIAEDTLKSNDSPTQQMSNGADAPSWSSYLNMW